MPRRSKPLLIASIIPLLALTGLFGIDQLHGTRYLPAFVVTSTLVFLALIVYVVSRMFEAKRARGGR